MNERDALTARACALETELAHLEGLRCAGLLTGAERRRRAEAQELLRWVDERITAGSRSTAAAPAGTGPNGRGSKRT